MMNLMRTDGNEGMKMVEYKGYTIEYNFYRLAEYSIQYCGDDLIFLTLGKAKEFIDSVGE